MKIVQYEKQFNITGTAPPLLEETDPSTAYCCEHQGSKTVLL